MMNERIRELQAGQEPVAWGVRNSTDDFLVFQNKSQAHHYATEWEFEVTPLYAAPVRTKDLTDDDICDKWKSITGYSISGGKKAKSQLVYLIPDEIIELARAVIAADREKNK